MGIKSRYLTLFFSALAIFVYLLVTPTLTGFVALEIQSLNLSLPYTTFDGGAPLTGTINLTLKGDIPANSTVRVEIDGESESLDLIEILRANNIEPEQTQTSLTALNPESSKTLNFDSQSTKKIAIKMKKGAIVDNITMDIQGIANSGSYPKTPSISFGDNTYNDWYYIGNFLGYGDNIIPLGLNEGQEGTVLLKTQNEDTLYCEKVNLPLASDFEIYSKFKILESQGVITDVSLLIVEQHQVIDECLIDNPAETLNWHSCELNLDRQISGEMYICLNMTILSTPSSSDLVEIAKDSVQGSGYVCDEGTSIDCTKDTNRDYFIRIKPGTYSKNLRTTEKIKDWETIPYSSRGSLTNYLSNCLVENITENLCVVPIAVNSESKGTIKLLNANIDYRLDSVSERVSLDFYDVSSTTQSAYTLPYSRSVTIPLSSFDLDVPNNKKNSTVEVSVLGTSVERIIQINPIIINLTDPAAVKINNIKTYLNNIRTNDLLKALKLKDLTESAYTKILDYETQIQIISDSNRTDSEKQTAYDSILAQADTLVNLLPKIITTKTKYSYESSVISPEEAVTEGIIEDDSYKDAIYALQNSITTNSEASLLDILYFSNKNETITLIKDVLTPKDSSVTNIEVVKVIPKTIANSASVIYSDPRPTVLKSDPILKFSLTMPNNEILTSVKRNVMDNVGEIKNLYLPEQIPTNLVEVSCGNGVCNQLEDYSSCPEDCGCGNNICEEELGETEETCPTDCRKAPWGLIITISLITILGLFIYIHLHGHPERQKKLIKILKFWKRKKLFRSNEDLKKLQQFIINAIAKGYTKEQIEKALLKKGWNNKQIEIAFKQ